MECSSCHIHVIIAHIQQRKYILKQNTKKYLRANQLRVSGSDIFVPNFRYFAKNSVLTQVTNVLLNVFTAEQPKMERFWGVSNYSVESLSDSVVPEKRNY